MSHDRRPPLRVLALPLLASAALGLAGCGSQGTAGPGTAPVASGTDTDTATSAPRPSASLKTNLVDLQSVPVDTLVTVSASHAQLKTVSVTSTAGDVAGDVRNGTWTASQRLEPGSSYTISADVVAHGKQRTLTKRFRTQNLSLDQQTFASIVPLAGQTVGVGMPVIVRFDIPVTDRAAMERQMHVVSSPAQPGSWHWISSQEVHWRPAHYWQAHTTVDVNLDVNGVKAGPDLWGQSDRHVEFTIGDSVISRVNTVTDQMKTYLNGTLVRTTPITTGQQPKYTTRSGVKIIIEKFRRHDMNSETIGIDPNSADGYNLKGVEYAMRLTYSGEFLHAAPWSVASQGHENVSHGCTGMSTENARWMFLHSTIGDVVEYTGTDRPMTLTNGYGDWNEPFSTYQQGSALH